MPKMQAWTTEQYNYSDDFPEVPDDYMELESIEGDDFGGLMLGEFLVPDSGESVVQVMDYFTTADDWMILLTANEYGDAQFWSSYAYFYRLKSGE